MQATATQAMTHSAIEVRNLVDGRFTDRRGAALDVLDPAAHSKIGSCPDSTAREVADAVDAAHRASAGWARTPVSERAAALRRLADRIESDLELFARTEAMDTGKPVSLARTVDIPRAISNLRFFADLAEDATGPLAAHTLCGAGFASRVSRRPLGVAACIAPWNLPLYLFTWKVAPALAAGCTVVGKPSEVTPLTAHMLAQRSIECGFPPGALNIVHGRGPVAGQALVTDPRVSCITFTGGTATGEAIARAAAPRFTRMALELGGKNAAVVLADACTPGRVDATADGLMRALFSNQGQVCHCAERVLVERAGLAALADALAQRASALRVGDPLEESTQFGSLISAGHRAKVETAIAAARAEGATILCGGTRPSPESLPERVRAGAYLLPTLMTGLAAGCRTDQEEIFGPVATIAPFDTDDEAITRANSTRFGLSATVWSDDCTRAARIADALTCGTVWINGWMARDLRAPIGGVKASGLGREGGSEALHFFAEPHVIVTPDRT
jgi:aminomuconate-semialdehyde/2-hydroxymuconate-6-semialdehyde dehydrogenase